ncbi:Arylamine N-acetyltransferase [Maioricimonas rarisocia]|uniref:Arylamine N-acetyltransferase n=1 Tax=Maioricimonas rarisocia TaxID=2528026 RepID=A0A517Z472_9PLAN|nr:arylamine N-acetyltransferase [Maioricimonas rarisocia]QDU37235.1 Arylamine N-acetyltransferase [Maioricimonas rarisocia]
MPASDRIVANYFERIGYDGEASPTLQTLQQIHRLHPRAIPFENLSSFLGLPVRLDLDSLHAKLVDGGRGGYCFEQNLLLRHVLEQLGFQVRCLAARVRWNVPDDVITPRSHMVMLVNLEGQPYVVDVGFGGSTLTTPIELREDVEQPTPHGWFRLLRDDEYYVLQFRMPDGWMTLYQFDLQEQHLPDYEVSNWYVSTHPDSHFTTGVIAARTDERGRHALRNNRYRLHRQDGGVEERLLETASELCDVLSETFGIRLPDVPELDERLTRLIATSEVPA